jgi:preprotein translocase subunit YajC
MEVRRCIPTYISPKLDGRFRMLAFFLLAEGEAAPNGSFWQQFTGSPLFFILLLLPMFYLLILRPSQVQEKQRRAKVSALKKNDKIINSGGIIGIVDSIKDDEVVLRGGLRLT